MEILTNKLPIEFCGTLAFFQAAGTSFLEHDRGGVDLSIALWSMRPTCGLQQVMVNKKKCKTCMMLFAWQFFPKVLLLFKNLLMNN